MNIFKANYKKMDTHNSNQNIQVKTNPKFQKNILADISIDKQSKKSKNQK